MSKPKYEAEWEATVDVLDKELGGAGMAALSRAMYGVANELAEANQRSGNLEDALAAQVNAQRDIHADLKELVEVVRPYFTEQRVEPMTLKAEQEAAFAKMTDNELTSSLAKPLVTEQRMEPWKVTKRE